MLLVHAPFSPTPASLPAVAIVVERLKLAKRLWRGVAEDGTEFGFELEKPLRHGDCVYESPMARYFIAQVPESLLEVSLDLPPSAAAGVGWAVGNLHLELMAEAQRLLTPDDKAARQLFDRLGLRYRPVEAVFRPGRFVRGTTPASPPPDELGASHRH